MTTGMIVEIVLAVVLLVILVVSLLALRRIQQLRRGGVDVALRPSPPLDTATGRPSDRGWRTGVGRYRGNQFRLFHVGGLRTAPRVVLDRTELEIVDRRPPRDGEMHAATATVLSLRTRGGTWEIAMAPDVLTGFSSWLESIPPGRSTGYRQAS
ncbi:hypothetical protein Acsp06_42290 [Actinomycetospora sp. NBRC 106375]|uniref:DUF2550 domain-containing protein n=1 Tax=Actinomycetospora sp. NBRC 106375 TaxID=3032207 RepID=UPI0024A4E47F|nr:DUF2550 domain-containing protein [Actinomycetospora sp. NBRC 106375]GLZ48044.1 hypothetical protein Acsp06_42290 [Actinomycetospora sp. NBRC 106375]